MHTDPVCFADSSNKHLLIVVMNIYWTLNCMPSTVKYLPSLIHLNSQQPCEMVTDIIPISDEETNTERDRTALLWCCWPPASSGSKWPIPSSQPRPLLLAAGHSFFSQAVAAVLSGTLFSQVWAQTLCLIPYRDSFGCHFLGELVYFQPGIQHWTFSRKNTTQRLT